MKVITDIHDYKPLPCAAAIGSFDGVHLGHLSMLDELRIRADEKGLPVMVVTFARHPRLLFDGGCEPFLLSSNEEKSALLEAAGVDYCVMLDFDDRMASMTAEQFMGELLVARLGVELLCVGYDHHFGKPQKGEGFEQYVEYGKTMGVELFKAGPFVVDGSPVSSSRIRRALVQGDIPCVKGMLGRNYEFSGKVVSGAGIGRSLGFPTANIELNDCLKMLPLDGVYDVRVECCGQVYKGVMNIGVKPTVGKNLKRTIEVNIIDFSGDIYGIGIKVNLLRRLRGEMAFESIELLRRQIETDAERVKSGF